MTNPMGTLRQFIFQLPFFNRQLSLVSTAGISVAQSPSCSCLERRTKNTALLPRPSCGLLRCSSTRSGKHWARQANLSQM